MTTHLFKPGGCMRIGYCWYVCLSVCLPLRKLITSGVIWCDHRLYTPYGCGTHCNIIPLVDTVIIDTQGDNNSNVTNDSKSTTTTDY